MKVVWSPTILKHPFKIPYYKNVWFLTQKQEVWLEPDRFKSVREALDSAEEDGCIRIAIIELND